MSPIWKQIYMGKVTNQDGCHTKYMEMMEKYFLYGHVLYQNEGNTKGKEFKHK